jgi:membrane fusion protein, multidrug efflux system
MSRKLVIGLLGFAVIAGGGFAAVEFVRGTRAAPQKAAPAVPVSVATVVRKAVPVNLTAVGNVEPYTSVALKARVDGEILSVAFKEGDEVKKDALLMEIDPRPFAVALAQAQANLKKDQALLDHAIEQEARYKDLLDKKFISPDAYDQVRTNRDAAAATVAADEAAIQSAKLSLAYCTIRSPVTGYAGRILIQQGNLVKANDTNPLVTINQVVPIYVSFSVPEQNIADIRKYQAAGDLHVKVALGDSAHAVIPGKLASLDNSADPATGTIRLRAEFPNQDKALWPGQFVNVVLTLHEQPDAIVTPSTALQNGPNGQYVFIVKPDATVELRDVKVARTEGDDTIVAAGLEPGDKVVVAGQLRLAPGVRITIATGAPTS